MSLKTNSKKNFRSYRSALIEARKLADSILDWIARSFGIELGPDTEACSRKQTFRVAIKRDEQRSREAVRSRGNYSPRGRWRTWGGGQSGGIDWNSLRKPFDCAFRWDVTRREFVPCSFRTLYTGCPSVERDPGGSSCKCEQKLGNFISC